MSLPPQSTTHQSQFSPIVAYIPGHPSESSHGAQAYSPTPGSPIMNSPPNYIMSSSTTLRQPVPVGSPPNAVFAYYPPPHHVYHHASAPLSPHMHAVPMSPPHGFFFTPGKPVGSPQSEQHLREATGDAALPLYNISGGGVSFPGDAKDSFAHTNNVYIRGLPSDFTDDLLREMASRYGKIVSSKAIIDESSGKCKGYGFVMYRSALEVQSAISGFTDEGFQASMAKDSFRTKLKHLQDKDSTNLYFSNLPLDMDEEGLHDLLKPSSVTSSRILREGDRSRGVGFARMADRETAVSVIERLNGAVIPGSNGPLLIRFADSAAQKKFKKQSSYQKTESVEGGPQVVWSPVLVYTTSPNIGPSYSENSGPSSHSGSSADKTISLILRQRSPPPINNYMSGYGSPPFTNQGYTASGYNTPHYPGPGYVSPGYVSSGYASPEMTSPYLGSNVHGHQVQQFQKHQKQALQPYHHHPGVGEEPHQPHSHKQQQIYPPQHHQVPEDQGHYQIDVSNHHQNLIRASEASHAQPLKQESTALQNHRRPISSQHTRVPRSSPQRQGDSSKQLCDSSQAGQRSHQPATSGSDKGEIGNGNGGNTSGNGSISNLTSIMQAQLNI
ncbi:hypothetical protein H4219_001149 [Mycoemilia scoparia]|uniref:RRM domain-containing protein n=1 Tax=Mycoemilia scoparia TaxID=417184 RepID=A0A9W8DS87_9FUNG|nr:hypothetical protein H4219_001149 [Mycoemilia scoparia]